MPILATGILTDSHWQSKRVNSLGGSLLELLVVLLIIGIIAGSTTFSLNPHKNISVNEVQRLYNLVDLARDEAIVKSREYGIFFTEESYEFLRYEKEKWLPFPQSDLFRKRVLSDSIDVALSVEDEEVELAKLSVAVTPEVRKPQVVIYSTGEFTQFSALMVDTTADVGFELFASIAEGVGIRPISR